MKVRYSDSIWNLSPAGRGRGGRDPPGRGAGPAQLGDNQRRLTAPGHRRLRHGHQRQVLPSAAELFPRRCPGPRGGTSLTQIRVTATSFPHARLSSPLHVAPTSI